MIYNDLAFTLEVVRLLSERPRMKTELTDLLSEFLNEKGQEKKDISQKLIRTIRKLRDCGFEIKSAPHHPYQLIRSNIALLLSVEQRESLELSVNLLTQLGYSKQANHLAQIASISSNNKSYHLKGNFHPSTDYSQDKISTIIENIRDRIENKSRYLIYYKKSNSSSKFYDIDFCELRLHDGLLYLFAYVPDTISERFRFSHNVDQNRLFRVDRIEQVGTSNDWRWCYDKFPTIKIIYKMTGVLSDYITRRPNEKVIEQNIASKYLMIETEEDCLFWFKQRMYKYGRNVEVLTPDWLREEIKLELLKAYQNYLAIDEFH